MTASAMDPDDLPADAAEWIRGCLQREGVDGAYLAFVARHLTVPDTGWRWCCGSHCDPCVEALGRVVDAARQRLEIGPPSVDPLAP